MAKKITAYKAFDGDFSCQGFKFKVGKTYTHKGPISICSKGFHSCEIPFDVWNFYPVTAPLAVVEASGKIKRHENDSKICSSKIKIKAKIKLADFIKAQAEAVIDRAKKNVATKGHAAATGDWAHAAATGDWGHAAATGDWGHAAATGFEGHAAATGFEGHAAATGFEGHAAATGDGGRAAATGDGGHAAATGRWGHAAATGHEGHAAATGRWGHAAATGDGGYAATEGKNAIAASLGISGKAKAKQGWIVLAHYDDKGEITHVRAGRVGKDVRANTWYRLNEEGKFEKVE